MFKCVCGKNFERKISLVTHQKGCKEFHKGKTYKCECGRTFETPSSLYAHCGFCNIYCNNHNKKVKESGFKGHEGWNKGYTKDSPGKYGEILRIHGEKTSKRLKKLGSKNPLVKWNKNKPKDVYEKQSLTRKKKYASGELVPAIGCGRGKYSYIVFNNEKIMLRSTYEFIYALYLIHNNIDFEYESVRVSAITKNRYAETFISDFLIKKENTVVEIKGNKKDGKVRYAKESFENSGYKYKVYYYDEIISFKNELSQYYDIDSILEKIKVQHDKKDYFVFYYDS